MRRRDLISYGRRSRRSGIVASGQGPQSRVVPADSTSHQRRHSVSLLGMGTRSASGEDRTALARRGRRLEYFTIAWNSLEGLVAIGAGSVSNDDEPLEAVPRDREVFEAPT